MTALVGQHRSESAKQLSGWSSAPADLVIPQMEVIFAVRDREASERLRDAQQDPSSPLYHKWLKPGEFVDKFGPTQDEVDSIVGWLQQEGFQITEADRNVVWFTGTAGLVQQAFGARMLLSPGGSQYCNIDDPQIPTRFTAVVSAIAGLDNLAVGAPAGQPHTPAALRW